MVSTFIGLLDIQSWWEIPCIAHFCSLFSAAFHLPELDIEDFEASLLTDGTDDTVGLLPELIVQLLRGSDHIKKYHHDITTSTYQMFLRRFFRTKCRQHNTINYFDTDTDFQSLPVRTKLLILHALCHFRLESQDVFTKFATLEADSLRVEPLGYDSRGSGYWYFFGTRLYREDQKSYGNTVWQVICFTEEDWKNLAIKFKKSRNRKERALLNILEENFLPKLPHLFREKEKLRRRKLFAKGPISNSARISDIAERKQKLLIEQQNQLIEQQQKVEQELQEQQQIAAINKRRGRSQSTSTISGISTYASSIRPSINSSDFLYRREKFCLSPDLGAPSISPPPQTPTIYPQLFPPTPSQSPIPPTSDFSRYNNYSDDDFDDIKSDDFNNCSTTDQYNWTEEERQKFTNDLQDIFLNRKSPGSVVSVGEIKPNTNKLPATATTTTSTSLDLIQIDDQNNRAFISTPDNTTNDPDSSQNSLIDIDDDDNHQNDAVDDDIVSISSVEEDKENFIFYKRSNTSDSTDSEADLTIFPGHSEPANSNSTTPTTVTPTATTSTATVTTTTVTATTTTTTTTARNREVSGGNSRNSLGLESMAPTTSMKVPGRQTNNSLSSLSGNIYLPAFEGGKVIKANNKMRESHSRSSSTSSTSSKSSTASSNSKDDAGNKKTIKKKKRKPRITDIVTESDEVLQIGMHKVLVYVKNNRDAWPFMDPVEEEIAPQYYSIIRRPMDLLKMEDKLDNGEYQRFDAFRNDFKLIVNNCRLYNGQHNEYTDMVNNLQDAFYKGIQKYFDQDSDVDEDAICYPDTKLNVFREKLFNRINNTVPKTSLLNSIEDDYGTSKSAQKYKMKQRQQSSSSKHHSKNDDDGDGADADAQAETKALNKKRRKEKEKEKRHRKRLKLNKEIADGKKEKRDHQMGGSSSGDIKVDGNSSGKINPKDNEDDGDGDDDDDDYEVADKLKSKKIRKSTESMTGSTPRKSYKKRTDPKPKTNKNSKIIKIYEANSDEIDEDMNEIAGDKHEHHISKKSKSKLIGGKLSKISTSSKSKSSGSSSNKLEIQQKIELNWDQKNDDGFSTYDYSSDNSHNDKMVKPKPSTSGNSLVNHKNSGEHSKASTSKHSAEKCEKDKNRKNKHGSSTTTIRDTSKSTESNAIQSGQSRKRKSSSKTHTNTEQNDELVESQHGHSKSKRQKKSKNYDTHPKKYDKYESDKNVNELSDQHQHNNDGDNVYDNESLMSLSRTPSPVFKVDLHKKYAKSTAIEIEQNKGKRENGNDEKSYKNKHDSNKKYPKSTVKSSKSSNKTISKNHSIVDSDINSEQYSSNEGFEDDRIVKLTPTNITPTSSTANTHKSIKPTPKKSKSSSTKKKSHTPKSKMVTGGSPSSHTDKSSALVGGRSVSKSTSVSPSEPKETAEKPTPPRNTTAIIPEIDISTLFLDKYDLIKQRRSRAMNSTATTTITTDEKWNQIVKDAEKIKDNKKNSAGGSNNKSGSSGTAHKDKNQKLTETIEKLKAKNEKSKERSVLIDEIFGVKPTREIRDEKAIYEKLRETCDDAVQHQKSCSIKVPETKDKQHSSSKKLKKETSVKSKTSKSQPNTVKSEITGKSSKKKEPKQNDKKAPSRKQNHPAPPQIIAPEPIAPPKPINSTKKKATTTKQSSNTNKNTMEALELETEQTLKDINRWLEHTPRFSEFSSASNSPTRYNLLDDFEAVASKLDPNDFRRPITAQNSSSANAESISSSKQPTKILDEPKLAETFEDISSQQHSPNSDRFAKLSPALEDSTKVITELIPSGLINKHLMSAVKEDESQSSSNATINSSSNLSSISMLATAPPGAANSSSSLSAKVKEPCVTQLLPHPPPPPPHIKSQLQKEAKRKTLKEKLTGASNVRRKDAGRPMDRFQPGKSKGNLLGNSKTPTPDELFALGGPTVTKFKEVKNSLVVKTDEGAPKLSLGSVLDTEGFGLGQLHNFGDEISSGELKISDAIISAAKHDDKKKIDNLTVSSSSLSDCGSKDASDMEKLKDEDEKEMENEKNELEIEPMKVETKADLKSVATPNLSAWFKAFGAPKKTKKQEEEELAAMKNDNVENDGIGQNLAALSPMPSSVLLDQNNSNGFANTHKSPIQATNENFSLPAPRQRKASTGSTISERSSFSQDPDSPRIGIDDRFYPGPYASPIGASPIMVSPKPDEIIKPSSPYPLNGAIKVGFYQDTTTKSSPEKSCSPRELPSPAYPQYSHHIYSSTSPNVNTDLQSTPNTTSPYGAGGGSNSNGSTNNGCYNPSVDPSKTPTGSGTMYSPTSPVTPATPNLYEQYKQPHSQESDYNSSMSPSTNPNSPYQQPQSSPYQHNPNSPYQQSSNQSSPYQQPLSPFQGQQQQQQQQPQSTQQQSVPSTNNANNISPNSMQHPVHSPGQNSQNMPQQSPQRQTLQIQSSETSHGQQSPYQQPINSPYQQNLLSPYQKNPTSPYHQPVPVANQPANVSPVQQQQQQQQQQQHQVPMNFGQQQQAMETNQQQQQVQAQNQNQPVKQMSPVDRQQYSNDSNSRYTNLVENPVQYQQATGGNTSQYDQSQQQQQHQTPDEQWKVSQSVASTTTSAPNPVMNLQQQSPMNPMNVQMSNVTGMGSVAEQMASMNQMQQANKSTADMQYSGYPQYSALSEKDNNNVLKRQNVYGNDLSNHMLHKTNPANILNPLHMQHQPHHQQHPPKRLPIDVSSGASLLNLGYSEPNTSMTDPKILKRNNDHQQSVDKIFDGGASTTLNKHQQMIESFLGSMASTKNLDFSKSMDMSASKAYEMYNKATAMGGFHHKDARMHGNLPVPTSSSVTKDLNNTVNSNVIQQSTQHNMTVPNLNPGKSIDNNASNIASYQQQMATMNQDSVSKLHNQNQQQMQLPPSMFSGNGSAGGSSKHSQPQQNHPSNYSQNMLGQMNNGNDKQMQIPASMFPGNGNGSVSSKHSQAQNHPSNYTQNMPSQMNNSNEKNQMQIPSSMFPGNASSLKQAQPQNHTANYNQNLPAQGNASNEKNHLVIPNPRQDQLSANLGRNMDLSNYKAPAFNSSSSSSSSSLLDPLRTINHSLAMLDDTGTTSMLGLQNPGASAVGYYDKSVPPAAHMFSKNLPQQIYQNPHYGMMSGRDQQNPPPPGNYVPPSSGVNNMSVASTPALQMEQPKHPEPKPKRGRKKKEPVNDTANNQMHNPSMLANSQSQQLQQQQQRQQQHQQQQQQQQHQQQSQQMQGVHHGGVNNLPQNMLNPNQTAAQAAAAAHHQGFQLYSGLKNAAAAAAASTSSGPGTQTSSADTSAISLKTATAASMVTGSPFNFGPNATGLTMAAGIYENTGYMEEFRGPANPYYIPTSHPPGHRLTPDPASVTGPNVAGGANAADKTNTPNTSNGGATAAAAAAAATASASYHQFLTHQASTQRATYPFINSPQLDPNSPIYPQYIRPDDLRAHMMHGLLPGPPAGYSQPGYRPPPTHLGIPKPYDPLNRNPWF